MRMFCCESLLVAASVVCGVEGGCVWSLFCYAVLSVLLFFCNHLAEEEKKSLLLYFNCVIAVL